MSNKLNTKQTFTRTAYKAALQMMVEGFEAKKAMFELGDRARNAEAIADLTDIIKKTYEFLNELSH